MEPEDKSPDCREKIPPKKILSASRTLFLTLPLTLCLICSPGIFAETFAHDESTDDGMATDTLYHDTIVNSPPGYQHRAWWITAIGAGSVAALASSGIDQDKRQHFGFSMILGAASEFGLRRLAIANDHRWGRIALATGIGMVPGLVKEVTDDNFDSQDALANALGSFVGAVLSDLIQGPASSHYGFTATKDHMALMVSYSF